MDAIRTARQRRGMSQRKLAQRSGLSFRGVQLVERMGHDARISSLTRIAEALGLPAGGFGALLREFFLEPGESFGSATLRILADGFDSWPIHLFDAVDAFRRDPGPELVERAPASGLDERLTALIASTVETLCSESSLVAPAWCVGVSALDAPWFVSGIENLKASALVEAPARFRARNVFVLANFLERV